MKKTVFIKNAAILTASSLILRLCGIVFRVWLAAAVGAEGIGLYQLIFSVYVFAATFATTGICTAVTRLIAEELALGSEAGVRKILRRSLLLTLLAAAVSTAAVFFGAEFIAVRLLGDVRAVPALRILPFSLPFMGISSCLRGYFIARRKASPAAWSQILEQAVRIGLVVLLVGRFRAQGLAVTCGAVLFGDTAAEAVSCGVLWLLCRADCRKLNRLSGRPRPDYGVVRRIIKIALPITAGRYLNSALRTGENILVPKMLTRHGDGQSALSRFGSIKGMALPILFFPSTLLGALSTLLIPEMSEASARGRDAAVRAAVERILKLTALTSYLFAAVFLTAGDRIGRLIYKSETVGFLLCALAPIVPMMYLDSVSDGILKGLDQQGFTFRTSVIDSSLRIVAVLVLLPRYGMNGFLGIMYASNLLTCGLNVGRLIRVSRAEISLTKGILLPVSAALCVTLPLRAALRAAPGVSDLAFVLLTGAVTLPAYAALLFATGCVSADDLRM